jgi:hypothetical protein
MKIINYHRMCDGSFLVESMPACLLHLKIAECNASVWIVPGTIAPAEWQD